MAAIINARDVLLQATTPRIETVTLDSNIIVPTSQVDGLPAIISGTKAVYLRLSSQIFQIAKAGTVSPASITLTPIVRNAPDTLTLTAISGTATVVDNHDGTYTLPYANMTSDTVTFKAAVTSSGVEYADTITVAKLREGTDTVSVLLSNENHTIAADSTGAALSYTGAGTTISVYIGTTDDTANWAFTKVDGTGVTSSISGSSLSVTAMTAGTATSYVDITASKGSVNIVKRMSLSKTRAGSAGGRGAGTYYATGSTWTDAAAAAACPGGPVVGDMVTIGNGTTYILTKRYDGSAWTAPGQIIDGNLFVTGSVQAAAVNTNNLTIRDASGTVLFGAGTKLDYKTWLANLPASLADINATQNTKLSGIASGATVGATFGVNIGGQINAANASTYLASAAIGSAYIADLSADKISAGTFSGASIAISGSSGWLLNAGLYGTTVSYRMLAGYNINANSLADPASAAVSGGSASGTGKGFVGYANYSFYSSGGTMGPFTGSHDALLKNEVEIEMGDIVVDVACIARKDMSNTLFEVVPSSRKKQKGALGVMAETNGPLSKNAPTVFVIEHHPSKEAIDDFGDVHRIDQNVYTPEYYSCKGAYQHIIVNAVGEGQMNVCGQNGSIESGDYITTSDIPGKGMRQDEEFKTNYTVARARENVEFDSPDQVKLVACIYEAG